MSFYECKIYKPSDTGELVHVRTHTADAVKFEYWQKVKYAMIGKKHVTGKQPRTRLIKCKWCKKESYVASPKAICCTDNKSCINNWRRSRGCR